MKKRKKKIAIISRESNSKSLDIAMLEAELLKRGCDVTVLSKLLTKEKSLKSLGYIGHVMRQEAAILAADVVVLDTYCIPASMIPHGKGTKVMQMWHALAAVKKFGWQTVGKAGGSSEKVAKLMRMHRGYDYVVSPSDITAEYFCEAFDTDRDKVVKYGLPRIDYIKSVAAGERHAEMAEKILTAYPQLRKAGPEARKTVLYAPTFRRGKTVDVQSLIDALDPAKYDLVVKLLRPITDSAVAVHADILIRPLGPGQHVELSLEGHVQAVVVDPFVGLTEGVDLVDKFLTAPLEGAAQEQRALLIELCVLNSFGISAPVEGLDLFGLQELFLHQHIQVDEVGVAREGGEGRIGAVAGAGGDEGEKLPIALTRRFQKVHKFVGALSHGADPIGRGQRA